MAESRAQARLRELKVQRRAAMDRAMGGSGEDSAISRIVNPPTPPKQEQEQPPQETVQATKPPELTDEQLRTVHHNRPARTQPTPLARSINKRQQVVDVGVMQRHVLFALVSAFLIKLASAGKTNLTK